MKAEDYQVKNYALSIKLTISTGQRSGDIYFFSAFTLRPLYIRAELLQIFYRINQEDAASCLSVEEVFLIKKSRLKLSTTLLRVLYEK